MKIYTIINSGLSFDDNANIIKCEPYIVGVFSSRHKLHTCLDRLLDHEGNYDDVEGDYTIFESNIDTMNDSKELDIPDLINETGLYEEGMYEERKKPAKTNNDEIDRIFADMRSQFPDLESRIKYRPTPPGKVEKL